MMQAARKLRMFSIETTTAALRGDQRFRRTARCRSFRARCGTETRLPRQALRQGVHAILWFETRRFASLPTMRIAHIDLILRSPTDLGFTRDRHLSGKLARADLPCGRLEGWGRSLPKVGLILAPMGTTLAAVAARPATTGKGRGSSSGKPSRARRARRQ